MAPLSPIITQIAPTDAIATSGTIVAQMSQPPGETDPGPFTYAKTADPGNAFSLISDQLLAARDLDGAFSVTVTSTSGAGASPGTTQTLTFADNENPYDDSDDPYHGNPNLPPPLAADATQAPWDYFIRMATNMLVPFARDGIDYVVARPEKTKPNESVYWDAAVLGPRPDAEIEALAKQLAAAYPLSGQVLT